MNRDTEYDMTTMVVKPLYYGMKSNVLVPAALIMVCYFLDQNRVWVNQVGEYANPLFYLFSALGAVHAGMALYWRQKMFAEPMIRREETFEQDLIDGILERSKPGFWMIAGIAVYGFAYYLLTGRFQEAVVLTVASFIVYQIVRPRFGFVRRLIHKQQMFVENGEFDGGPGERG